VDGFARVMGRMHAQIHGTLSRALVVVSLSLVSSSLVSAQIHEHEHGDHHHAAPAALLTIEQVLALEQNRGLSTAATRAAGVSGDGAWTFKVLVTAKSLPKKVLEPNPFGRGKNKKPILDYAHGGFAYDHRKGKGEVYWFLQGAGMMRIHRDRSKIELLPTDPKMVRFNMHNATFFVHGDEARIAWPANGGQRVFITDVDGKLLHTIGRPTMAPYSNKAGYAPTDTAYLDGKLWVTDGYASKFIMSYDLDKKDWTGTIFGGKSKKKVPEPGKFGTNHGITIHKGLIYVAGRYFARIHSYKPDTKFVDMFPMPDGSKPCDFEFFAVGDKLYGVAASLNTSNENKKKGDKGAAIYIVDMTTLKIVSTIKPKDELGLKKFTHLHNVFPSVDEAGVTLFCQAWNTGDFAILRQASERPKKAGAEKIR
jgi:hypothetical protein